MQAMSHLRSVTKPMQGITLTELMLVTVILGIFLSLGVPSLNEYINLVRTSANQRDLVSSLKFAHSEAVKRSSSVSVCIAATTANTCDTDSNASWNQGWYVFTDSPPDLIIANPTEVLQASLAQSSSTIIFATPQFGFSFQGTGEINNIINPQIITTCAFNANNLTCDGASESGQIAVMPSGQIVIL